MTGSSRIEAFNDKLSAKDHACDLSWTKPSDEMREEEVVTWAGSVATAPIASKTCTTLHPSLHFHALYYYHSRTWHLPY